MTFANKYPTMTNFQIELFWAEVEQIQKRHSIFFPISQLKYISIKEQDSIPNIIFLEEYDLPTPITNEIHLAFKMISDIPFV